MPAAGNQITPGTIISVRTDANRFLSYDPPCFSVLSRRISCISIKIISLSELINKVEKTYTFGKYSTR